MATCGICNEEFNEENLAEDEWWERVIYTPGPTLICEKCFNGEEFKKLKKAEES